MSMTSSFRCVMDCGSALTFFGHKDKTGFLPFSPCSPCSKEIQSLLIPPQPYNAPVYNRGIEAGDPEYFVSNGYAHVIVDVRGITKSGGQYHSWMSDQKATDEYDLLEWIGVQPWCYGNVGMVGVSCFGGIQLNVAAKQPPHLKAIMPMNAG
jgi:putative CocE/NonD family hydrolase